MILANIEDKEQYLNETKEKMTKYFTIFFGKKYSDIIKEKLQNVQLACVDRKNTHVALKKSMVENKTQKIYIDFFQKILQEEELTPETYQETMSSAIKDVQIIFNFLERGESQNPALKLVLSKYFTEKNLENNYDKIFCGLKKVYENKYAPKLHSLTKIKNDYIDENATTQSVDDVLNNQFFKNLEQKGFPIQEFRDRILGFLEDKTCVAKCSFKKNNKDEVFSLTVFDTFEFILNTVFVHELLHIISLTHATEQNPYHKSGLGYVVENTNNQQKRKFGDLDEICTEYFARKVVKIMKFDNFSPFCNESTKDISIDFFERFIEKHINILKEAYMSHNPLLLEKYFGSENCVKLNNLAEDVRKLSFSTRYKAFDFDKEMEIALEGSYPKELENFYSCFEKYYLINKSIDIYLATKNSTMQSYE